MLADRAFAKKLIDERSLAAAGFARGKEGWTLSEEIMPGLFRADLTASPGGKVSGKVTDLETGDEYLPLEVESAVGGFTGRVRMAYIDFLEKTASFFMDLPFESRQANRIAVRAAARFGTAPEVAFSRTEGAVFRNERNGRWFAVVLKADTSVLRKPGDEPADGTGESIEIMNVKVDPEKLSSLLEEPGIYICWHMNKKLWVSIALDDEADDDRIMELMSRSHELVNAAHSASSAGRTGQPAAWVIPSKPAHYDVAQGFADSPDGTITWHQRIGARPGDEVFIYQTAPIAAITFRCEAVETDIPLDAPSHSTKRMMRLRLLERYPEDRWPRSFLNEHGIKVTVRGQRSMPDELYKIIKSANSKE
jgi:predicted DNA-binding protein (MmcQ/YjbR family)